VQSAYFNPLDRPRTIYVDVLDYSAYLNASGPDVFRDAFAYWEAREDLTFKLVDANTDRSKMDEHNTVFIEMVREGGYGANGRAYLDVPNHHHEGFYIALGDHNCRGVWRAYTYNTVLHLVEHEFGHILGYYHNNVSTDLMFGGPGGFGFYRYVTDVNETVTVPSTWMFPYGLCSATRTPFNDTMREYKFDVASSQPMDFYVVPSMEEYQNAFAGKQFSTVPGCLARNVHSFKMTCNVTDASMLLIKNIGGPSDPASKVDVLIQEVTPLAPYEKVFIATISQR